MPPGLSLVPSAGIPEFLQDCWVSNLGTHTCTSHTPWTEPSIFLDLFSLIGPHESTDQTVPNNGSMQSPWSKPLTIVLTQGQHSPFWYLELSVHGPVNFKAIGPEVPGLVQYYPCEDHFADRNDAAFFPRPALAVMNEALSQAADALI